MSDPKRLQVGDWLVEPDLDRITGPSGSVMLMPKAMAVLVYLAERPGEVVSAEALIEAIWHGRPMGDNPVYKCISELRTALGDDRKTPAYIATVPTKGYRLVASVHEPGVEAQLGAAVVPVAEPGETEKSSMRLMGWLVSLTAAVVLAVVLLAGREGSEPGTSEPAMTPKGEQPSIAVLPFANISADEQQDYFADGLTEELITQLALVQGLRVIGRTSSFAFKGRNEDLRTIGDVLGVNHVLEGSVRRSGDRVRVTAQLIDPEDGSHLWTQSYDRGLADVVTLQEEIAKTVAMALRLSITARIVHRGGTSDFAAYDAYLAGLAAAGRGGADNVLSSIDAFEKAVSLDPGFVAAWETLAGALQQAMIDVPRQRAQWQARLGEVAQHIHTLSPDRPLLTHLAAQQAAQRGDLLEAERLYRAIQSSPSTPLPLAGSYGTFLLNVGRPRDALVQFNRELHAEPLELDASLWVQIALELAGEFELADQEYRRALDFSEDTRAVRTMALIRAMGQRDVEAIRHESTQQIAVGPQTRALNESMLRHLEQPGPALADLRRRLDDPGNANNGIVVMNLAAWAGYFGDPELALAATRRLPLLAGSAFNWTAWRPVLSEMRQLPGFRDMVRDWGLVDYWRATGEWGAFCRPVGETDFECDTGSAGQ